MGSYLTTSSHSCFVTHAQASWNLHTLADGFTVGLAFVYKFPFYFLPIRLRTGCSISWNNIKSAFKVHHCRDRAQTVARPSAVSAGGQKLLVPQTPPCATSPRQKSCTTALGFPSLRLCSRKEQDCQNSEGQVV